MLKDQRIGVGKDTIYLVSRKKSPQLDSLKLLEETGAMEAGDQEHKPTTFLLSAWVPDLFLPRDC